MEKDSIIKLEYDAWIVETNELFDTTHEDTAKAEDIFNENVKYEPQPLIVGAQTVVKGLDDDLLKAELGKEYEVEIPPDNAYGKRDPKLVELHNKREILRLPEFRKGDTDPAVGMQVTMKGKVGTITAITAGRVRVDFNNKLAGRTLKYKYKVTSAAESTDDKINAIIEIHYGSSENFVIETKDNDAKIVIPDTCKYDQRWYLVKHRIVTDLQNFTGMETVSFIEEYKKREEPKPDEKADDEGKTEKSGSDEVSVETSDKSDEEDVTVSIDQEIPPDNE